MKKDMEKNLAIGFAIGFFFFLIWSYSVWSDMGMFWLFFIAIIAGFIGASLGYIETIVQRKNKAKKETKAKPD